MSQVSMGDAVCRVARGVRPGPCSGSGLVGALGGSLGLALGGGLALGSGLTGLLVLDAGLGLGLGELGLEGLGGDRRADVDDEVLGGGDQRGAARQGQVGGVDLGAGAGALDR